MKNLFLKCVLFLIFVFLTNQTEAQNKKVKRAEFNLLTKAGSFTEYVSKDGYTIKIGDTLQIQNPSNFERYMYITQNDAYLRADQMQKKFPIKAINVSGDKKKGFTVYCTLKGSGATPVFVRLEDALTTNEIKWINHSKDLKE